MTTVRAQVGVSRGAFRLDADIAAADGEVIALVGPNGAGKTTLLRALAGLEEVDGRIVIDGTDMTARPPERRPVAWVPQRVALFPHLSALDNVAFGVGGRRGRGQAHSWLRRLGIAELADRKPAQLSGGQAQKVALARALAREPVLLLLDEPLAALDTGARTDVRRALRTHLREFGGVTVLVTHDIADAATLADRLVAVEAGRIVQDGAVRDVARAPRAPWLATMLGANACRGRSRSGAIDLDGGGRLVAVDVPVTDGIEMLAVFAPHAVVVSDVAPSGSARNAWPVTVRHLVDLGGRVRVDADGRPPVVAEVTAAAVAELGLHEGAQAWVSVKATEVTVVAL